MCSAKAVKYPRTRVSGINVHLLHSIENRDISSDLLALAARSLASGKNTGCKRMYSEKSLPPECVAQKVGLEQLTSVQVNVKVSLRSQHVVCQ